MLKDLLQFIYDQAQQAANPTPHVRRIDKRNLAVTLNGETNVETIHRPDLLRFAFDVSSFGQLTLLYGSQTGAVVYVSGTHADAILDDDDRFETVRLRFESSNELDALKEASGGLPQKQLIRLLRTTLAGCVRNDDFLAIIRQVQFDVMRENRHTTNNTSESLGRKVEKQVKAKAGAIPDEISVTIPMFKPLGVNTTQTIKCAVVLDMDSEEISLVPIGSELQEAKLNAVAQIEGRLLEMFGDGVPVLKGEAEHMYE